MERAVRLAQLADSYLDHIRIAVAAGDTGAPFRDFVDNWAAYTSDAEHHRTLSDRVIWFNNPDAIKRRAMLLSIPFRSVGAEVILQLAMEKPDEYRERRMRKDGTVRLVVDHAIPVAVITELLCRVGTAISRETVRAVLERFHHLGLVSADENSALNAVGLQSRMPTTWDGVDVIARYRAASIEAASFVEAS